MNDRMRFENRAAAGRALAGTLAPYAARPDVVVLALPRGGVPVGFAVAQALGAPLDVFLVRKLGAPGQEELAMGAIATGNVVVLNQTVIDSLRLSGEALDAAIRAEAQELRRRERLYRGDRPAHDVTGRVVILVDDGLATGASMRAAARAVRGLHPARVVVAVPVAAAQTCVALQAETDEVICLYQPDPFIAVGMWYEDFSQTTDEQVCDLLRVP